MFGCGSKEDQINKEEYLREEERMRQQQPVVEDRPEPSRNRENVSVMSGRPVYLSWQQLLRAG